MIYRIKGFSISTVSKSPFSFNKSLNVIKCLLSQINLFCCLNIFNLKILGKEVQFLDAQLSFVSTLKKEIGLQFLISCWSLSFFSIHLITACFWEVLNSLTLKALLRLKKSVFRSSQNALLNSFVILLSSRQHILGIFFRLTLHIFVIAL